MKYPRNISTVIAKMQQQFPADMQKSDFYIKLEKYKFDSSFQAPENQQFYWQEVRRLLNTSVSSHRLEELDEWERKLVNIWMDKEDKQ